MTAQVRDLDHFDSIRSQLEQMKVFGEKLELQELRMSTIKDKIEIFASQVQSLVEQPVQAQELAQETQTLQKVYVAVDADDPLDCLVSTAMTERFKGITVVRQAAGLYLIQGKSVTVSVEGEKNDQLKVRVGSTRLEFADYMTQVKVRLEREETDVQVEAELENAESAAASSSETAAKSKKKKKKAKKKTGVDLDLDMDNDDAAEQTRFAGLVKNEEVKTSSDSSPKKSRRSLRGKIPVHISGRLDALAEVSEDDSSEADDGEEAND